VLIVPKFWYHVFDV